MDLSQIRKTLEQMTTEELQASLQTIRQNRRTPAARPHKAETKTKVKKDTGMSLEALLTSAMNNPEMKAALLAQLQGGKK